MIFDVTFFKAQFLEIAVQILTTTPSQSANDERANMTLTTSNDVPSAQGDKPQFLIFFSSGNPPWCPDCVDAQPAVEKVFGGSGVDGHIVLVGEKPEWVHLHQSMHSSVGRTDARMMFCLDTVQVEDARKPIPQGVCDQVHSHHHKGRQCESLSELDIGRWTRSD